MSRSPCKSANSTSNRFWQQIESSKTGVSSHSRKLSAGRALPLIHDKENTDPCPKQNTPNKIVQDPPVQTMNETLPLDLIEESPVYASPLPYESNMEDSEPGADGFNISDEFQLDDPNGVTSQGGYVQQSSEDSSPFVLSSLISNRVIKLDAATTLKLSSGEEGCSPALEQNRKSRPSQEFSTPGPSNRTSGPVKFRRCISMIDRPLISSPELLKQPISAIPDFTSPVSRTAFKRPGPPLASGSSFNMDCKKLKLQDGVQHKLVRSHKSETCVALSPSIANIMHACSLSDKPNLTADRTSKLSLPTIQGAAKNNDLNNIDCHVMAKLLNGDFADKVASFRVIDARYQYEFEGGHIRGAENFGMWDEKSFLEEFFPNSLGPKVSSNLSTTTQLTTEDDENEAEIKNRSILIFHCEFSSARGPALLRALRKKDRELNKNTYPALHYPECYLLHDGYKTFFANYPQLCEPQSYIPMAHPNFVSEERKFHKRSRTWAGAGGANTVTRTGASSRLLKL